MDNLNATNNLSNILPNFATRSDVLSYLNSIPNLWETFSQLPEATRELMIGFFLGENGLPVTYDTVFRMVFNPYNHGDRIEALLSALFGRKVKIIDVLSREGTQLSEKASFVIMDVLVVLDDGTYANVEMQKIGYQFPIERSDCYSADIIMRQYSRLKAEYKDSFSFKQMGKVFCIVLMEHSPAAFHEAPSIYKHNRYMQFNTGIMRDKTGLHEDIFLCLDTFQKNIHNVDATSSMLDVWLTFLSSTDTETILHLITEFPEFLPIYKEISEFALNPEELLHMFSEELYIMDRNAERLMVTELEETVAAKDNIIAEKDNALAEKDNVIAEKDNALAEQDNVIAEKDALIAQLQAKLAEQIQQNQKA